MNIAILNAETLPQPAVENFGSYGDMFVELLQPFDSKLHFTQYFADQQQLPTNPDTYDAFIVTGSRHNAYDIDPWIIDLKHFIQQLQQQKRKCLGICFGHQIIAEALGGKVEKNEKGWGIGVGTFSIEKPPAWIETSQHAFNILISHQDQVSLLPDGATRIATNSFCPNGGYFIENHIFCLQGHPEFNREYIQFLIAKRHSAIGHEKVTSAHKQLNEMIIDKSLGKWIYNFISLKS